MNAGRYYSSGVVDLWAVDELLRAMVVVEVRIRSGNQAELGLSSTTTLSTLNIYCKNSEKKGHGDANEINISVYSFFFKVRRNILKNANGGHSQFVIYP